MIFCDIPPRHNSADSSAPTSGSPDAIREEEILTINHLQHLPNGHVRTQYNRQTTTTTATLEPSPTRGDPNNALRTYINGNVDCMSDDEFFIPISRESCDILDDVDDLPDAGNQAVLENVEFLTSSPTTQGSHLSARSINRGK